MSLTIANLAIYQGDDYAATVTVLNQGTTTPPDLTGYTAQAQIRVGPADANPQVVAQIGTLITTPNLVTLSIPASMTICMTNLYTWDLQLITPGGMTETILAGKVTVTEDVTRAASPSTTAPPLQQSDVTATRSVGTVYMNSSATLPLYVLITVSLVNKNDAFSFKSDTVTPPVVEVAQAIDPSSSGGVTVPVFFIVPPGSYYSASITGGSPTIVHWIEYQ